MQDEGPLVVPPAFAGQSQMAGDRPQERWITAAIRPPLSGGDAETRVISVRVEIAWRACRFAANSGSLKGAQPGDVSLAS
jgi:hypothetical protein